MIDNLLGFLSRFFKKRVFVLACLKVVQFFRIFFYKFLFSDNQAVVNRARINQPLQLVGRGKIELGEIGIGVWPSPCFLSGCAYFEARGYDSKISIGNNTSINNGAVIIADRSTIEIGGDCFIGLSFSVFDSDFHGLEVENRVGGNYECASVKIGNNVFIGNNVTVLKGVSIGDGAVIGNGSVVVKDVPSMTVFAGVPAVKIKTLHA